MVIQQNNNAYNAGAFVEYVALNYAIRQCHNAFYGFLFPVVAEVTMRCIPGRQLVIHNVS